MIVRRARLGDLDQIAAIYAHAVQHGTATLDTEEPTGESMRGWLARHTGRNAAVVVERDGVVLGYGTLSPFAERGGYFPSTEISLYVHPRAQGTGVGQALGLWLLDFARKTGYTTVICFVTDTNTVCLALVAKAGFRRVGVLEHIGHKLGDLISLEVFQLVFPENLARYREPAMLEVAR